MTTPEGSTITDIPGGRRIIYPVTGERLVIQFAPQPDPRDARIAELEAQLAAIAAAMRAYADSDLVSLATTLRVRCDACGEMRVEQEMGY